MERVRDVISANRAHRQSRALSRPRRRRDLRRRPVRVARRVRGRRPPPHRQDVRHRHRLASRRAARPRPRYGPLSHQRDRVRPARAGAFARRHRQRADRLRARASVSPPGQRSHRGGHGVGRPAARGPRSGGGRPPAARGRRHCFQFDTTLARVAGSRGRNRRHAQRQGRRRANATAPRICLLAAGRRLNTEGPRPRGGRGRDGSSGRIVVDDRLRTSQRHIYVAATLPAACNSRTWRSTTPASSCATPSSA